ncbi:MAG: hypothetical protein WAK17_18515 [Candidatus Nitrosopolaris sp.]|jgi:hypothetical protein
MITTRTNSSSADLREQLVHEALGIPSGWFKQVFYDRETKELTFSSPMRGGWVSSQNTIGFLDHIDYIEGYETESQMVKAALEESWFSNIVNSYLLVSDEKYSLFR